MKALMHLVAQESGGDALAERIVEILRGLRQEPDAKALQCNAMTRVADDPFGRSTPYCAAIEIVAEAGCDAAAETIEAVIASKLAPALDGIARKQDSTLLLGEDVVFIASERSPIRYQYLMRRKGDFTHASYLKRYREIHSRFGLETPGILGYVQFHVDADASERAARSCGMGVWDVDSVSELHLESIDHFLDQVSRSQIAGEAAADEEIFVDRARSHDFCSSVDWHR